MPPTHISGIVVTLATADIETGSTRLQALAGVDVHYRHDRRLVVTQETSGSREQQEGLRTIQALPEVAAAQLVYHVVEPEAEE